MQGVSLQIMRNKKTLKRMQYHNVSNETIPVSFDSAPNTNKHNGNYNSLGGSNTVDNWYMFSMKNNQPLPMV